jgi:hypothetical protein
MPLFLCSIPENLIVSAFQPPLRRRRTSILSTPTLSKSVRFGPRRKLVGGFLQVERPLAVAAGSYPVESDNGNTKCSFSDDGYFNLSQPPLQEWEIIMANFPAETCERLHLPVRVEKMILSPDNRELIGTVAVANLAFDKTIVVRFTLDFWRTTSDMLAVFADDAQQDDGYDRFNFAIEVAELANLDKKPMFLCVKYCVNDVEYWDNNNNHNFQVEFRKRSKPMSGQRVL